LAASNFLLQHGALFEPIKSANREPLAGYIYASKTSGHIFVEHNDLLVRRRFSVAHELGHYLLHFRPLIMSPLVHDEGEQFEISEAISFSSANEDVEDLPTGRVFSPLQAKFSALLPAEIQMEDEANQFAAELLMPAEIVQALVKRYSPVCRGDDLLWRLATEMLVSKAATYRRLKDLQLSVPVSVSWN
jgi:Zn-dependent peptidase ImmA (M78 family)